MWSFILIKYKILLMPKTIYLTILVLVIVTLISLPIIHLPISSSSRGVVRSVQENTQLTAVVSGKVIETKLEKNNQNIRKGEALLIVTAEQLDTQKNIMNLKIFQAGFLVKQFLVLKIPYPLSVLLFEKDKSFFHYQTRWYY